MKNLRHPKYYGILALALSLLLASMPVLARTYPFTDREAPYDGDVLMVSNLQAITSKEDESLIQSTGLSIPEGTSNDLTDLQSSAGTSSGRMCASLLHDRHTIDDFPGLLTETGLPKAPVAGGKYKRGDTKEIYNDCSSGGSGSFTAVAVYVGMNCTIWWNKAYSQLYTDDILYDFLIKFDFTYLPRIYNSLGKPSSVDVDGDGRIALVFSPMESTKSYFSDADLFSKSDVSWASGNQMDMIHINPTGSTDELMLSAAHELAHMILFSKTFGESELWLEEVAALTTVQYTESANDQMFPDANALIEKINSQGISVPFIGGGNYAPSGRDPYGQWYLFACYLAGQTRFYPNGGDSIFRTMVDSISWSHNGFTAGSCTKEALMQALTDIGYIAGTAGKIQNFEDFILNYHTALYLRDVEGIYSMNNSGEPDNAGGISLNKITPFTGTIGQLPGGGAACWLASSGNITPNSPGADIRYAGISAEPLVTPAAVESSVQSGKIEPGTMVTLSCQTEGARIYYTTDENNLTFENPTLYTEPIAINTDTYLRTWAIYTSFSEEVPGPETTFRYQVTESVQGDAYEENNDFSSATAVSFPGVYKATLHLAEDTDYYAFKLENPATLKLVLTSPAGSSYGLALYRENDSSEMEELKTSHLSNGTQSIRLKADSGTYYVAVSCPENGNFSDKEEYTLDLQRECASEEELRKLDFSEIHMVNALADEESSPLAYIDVLNNGGNFLKSAAYLTSWAGPALETKYSYPDEDAQYEYTPVYIGSDSLYHVQNILFLPQDSQENFIKHLKNAVYTYGAAEIFVMSAWNYQADNSTYWYVDKEEYDYRTGGDATHIVTVVGWDDTISRELFNGSGDEPTPLPEKDGAFIVRNSWGEDSGEDGYFYLSYEDYFMTRNSPAVYIADESPENYNHQYLNDIKGGCGTLSFDDGQPLTMSEVFTQDNPASPELLKAVSMQIASANTHYEISVKIGDDAAQKVAEGTKNYGGYYTVRLDKPLLIPSGERFEIIVRLESTTEPVSIFCTANMVGRVGGVPSAVGKAFYYDGSGEPEDLSSQALYPCIRAFTCDVASDGYRATAPAQDGSGNHTDSPAKDTAKALPGGSEATEGQAAGEQAAGGQAATLPEHLTLTGADAPKQASPEQASPSRYGALAVDYRAGNKAGVPSVNLPERFDLRETLTLPPVRNQGYLNVCWAFASTACVENSLASRDANVVDYPSSLSLSQSTHQVVLDKEQNEQAVTLTADLNGSKNPPSSKIFWSVTGDIDSIRMEHTESFSGDAVQVLTALKPGTVTITAQSDADMNILASCKLTITNQGVESLELAPQKLDMKIGETSQLKTTVQPENAVDQTVLFESSQPDIAYVDKEGKVTALSEGTTLITARAGTAEATCQVTVKKLGKEDGASDSETPPSGDAGDSGDSGASGNSGDLGTKPSGSDTSSGSSVNPAAGDTGQIAIAVLLVLCSAGIAGIMIRLKCRRRRER